jgi:hypothetical protein
VLLANALQITVFVSDTYPSIIHDNRIAAETPYPLPVGSKLLQDLGFMRFTRDGVRITQLIRKPAKALTHAKMPRIRSWRGAGQ